MVERNLEALVKEERQSEATSAAVPPPIFRQRGTADSLCHGFQSLPSSVMRLRPRPFLWMILGQDKETDLKTGGRGARGPRRAHGVARG
jgi:hypothetical protein